VDGGTAVSMTLNFGNSTPNMFKVGIYNDSGELYPANLIVSQLANSSAIGGYQTVNFTDSVFLPPGKYWIAYNNIGPTIQLIATTSSTNFFSCVYKSITSLDECFPQNASSPCSFFLPLSLALLCPTTTAPPTTLPPDTTQTSTFIRPTTKLNTSKISTTKQPTAALSSSNGLVLEIFGVILLAVFILLVIITLIVFIVKKRREISQQAKLIEFKEETEDTKSEYTKSESTSQSEKSEKEKPT